MKTITILLILLTISYFSYSQELDKIYLKSKEVVSGKILKVTSEIIEIDPEGSKPFIIIKRDDATVIIYSDNTVVNLVTSASTSNHSTVSSSSSGESGTLTDVDGNVYKTIKIGNQWWMAENFKGTRYDDGTAIPYVTSIESWRKLKRRDAAYCYYNNDSGNKSLYSALYTWEAARKAAPKGWHLPTDEEWKQLEKYLGMSHTEADKSGWRGTNEGIKLSETIWRNNDTFGGSGFDAIPGGRRYHDGSFYYLNIYANFWSATETLSSYAWSRSLHYDMSEVYRGRLHKNTGMSVRYIKDN